MGAVLRELKITANGYVASFEITSVYLCTLQATYIYYFDSLQIYTTCMYDIARIKDMDNCVTFLWNVNICIVKNKFIVAYLKM